MMHICVLLYTQVKCTPVLHIIIYIFVYVGTIPSAVGSLVGLTSLVLNSNKLAGIMIHGNYLLFIIIM